MVDESWVDMTIRLRRFWYPVAFVSELADAPFAVELLGESLVVAPLGERVLVARNRCPHKSARLEMGRICDDQLECGYHGLRFDSVGSCVANPARPGRTPPRSVALSTVPTEIRYGMVWVCLEPSWGHRVPDFHAWVADPSRVEELPTMRWSCAPNRQVEGICDLTHFSIVHPGTLEFDGEAPAPTITETEQGIDVTFLDATAEGRQFWDRIYRITIPFTVEMTVRQVAGGGHWTLYNAASPVSMVETRVFATMVFDGPMAARKAAIGEFERTVFDQDRRVIESIDPMRALDVEDEVVFSTDRHLLRYRQLLLSI